MPSSIPVTAHFPYWAINLLMRFDTHQQAQDFLIAAGGSESDPHRLDGNDNDGLACESLP
ncbi:hypothetical protein [Gracilibacillus sp. YIM 98692]|uniref:hypothetical protein n=1 Tax=Gracilibacillus sp. YIM 98692 TaxID=2663532 RepID=UPI0013D1E069|nr:hypothetical protein [Gracilibacillus sp. YIM 98692]